MKIIYTSFIILLVSCHTEDINLFPQPTNPEKAIRITKIDWDTIVMEHIESSYLDKSGITQNNDLFFIDTYYCYFFTFDTLGNFKHRYLGQGRAPHETTAGKIAGYTLLPDGDLFLLGFQLDHHVYDSTFNLKKTFFLERNKSTDITKTSAIYTHQYDRLACKNYNDNVYFNMYSEHPNLDYIAQTDRYMKKCRHISEVNIQTEADGRMLGGGYPEFYKSNPLKFLVFSGINFDIDNQGNVYVSYEADSLIYKYDFDYTPLLSFGFSEKNMNTGYKKINSYKECRKYHDEERKNKGYYGWLQYINETNTLFRSYTKGDKENSDGLQIYENIILIGDVPVPKTLKIAGYIKPYYYSQAIIDEEKEQMIIYRFKLPG
ncbi:hypothetical protein AALK14_13115 [Butyricimonas hominis]|uniref:DUF4221 domain-containing protein n=1 Tax=Butyricimonas hominis TaxID=2763032 RepID=A0ABR7CZC1_9BACT|nr:hypothetical protein [Butyricimonas hominis]MBC5620959.1 hypothetical protein [Butyricimonas hominis]